MAKDDAVQLIVRGLGRAELSVGPLEFVPEAGTLFPLALILAQRAGERIPRAWLIEALWPGADDGSGRHSLRQAMYRLRKAGLVTEDRGDDVWLAPDAVASDLTRTLRHDWPYRAAPAEIERAASVLPGFEPPTGVAYVEWYDQLRARLSSQYRLATLHQLGAARREGRWNLVDHWALMCLQEDPLNEEATLARAEAAAMRGAKNAALEILDTFLEEIGDRQKQIGLPARLLKRRISEFPDTTGRRIMATSAPFVGRHEQIARAVDAMREARGGEAQVLWFVGPSGIGKTRFLRELGRIARMDGWCAVVGGARPSYEERPFALLIEVLPHLLDAPGALGTDPDSLHLLKQSMRADGEGDTADPEEIRGRQLAIGRAFGDLLEAVLTETGVVLLLDDAQWADATTLGVLSRFIESHGTARLALIAATRRIRPTSEIAHRRLRDAPAERLTPLSPSELTEFASALRVSAALPADVAERLATTSGGNPLFFGHLLHHHEQLGARDAMPSDLAALIDQQLAALSREALRVLQACALLGPHATLPRLERVLGIQAHGLVTPLGELDDVLALPADPGQPLQLHDLWSERVRAQMTAGVHRALAVSTARVLESDAQDDANIDMYWSAARLFEESGERQLAFAAMLRCGDYLAGTGAGELAARAYGVAVRAAASAPAQHTALSRQLIASHSTSDFTTAGAVIAALRALASEHPALPLTPEQSLLAIETEHFAGGNTRMHHRLAALATDDAISVDTRVAAIHAGLATADNFHDELSRDFFLESFERLAVRPADELIYLRAAAISATVAGRFSEAITAARDLVALSRRRSPHPRSFWDLRLAAAALRRSGTPDEAIALLDESQILAKRRGHAVAQFLAADVRAGTSLDYARLDQARHAISDAESLYSEAMGRFPREALAIVHSFVSLATGDFKSAQRESALLRPLDLSSHSRHSLLQAAIELRLSVASGNHESAQLLLQHLTETHGSALRFGGADQIALAVYQGLAALRGRADASEFASRYRNVLKLDLTTVPFELL